MPETNLYHQWSMVQLARWTSHGGSCKVIAVFWGINFKHPLGWRLLSRWKQQTRVFFLHSWKDELPGGRMTRVWRLMIKWTGTIMNYLWDASTSVECTHMTKRQAISFSRSLIRSILLQVTAPCFISKLVFQCFPVPISETGRILWDLFYKQGA